MQRRRILLLGALAVATVYTPCLTGADVKIGYIDSAVLREQMPEFNQVQRQLERLAQQYEQEAMERQSKQLGLREDFRRQELLMSESRKAEMEAELSQTKADLEQFTRQKLGPNGELFRKNVELTAPIFEIVNSAIETIAAKEGFDFIFDVAGTGFIVYADPNRYNLTEQLLQELDRVRQEQRKSQ